MLENVSSAKEAKTRMEEYIKMRKQTTLYERWTLSAYKEENLNSVLGELNNS